MLNGPCGTSFVDRANNRSFGVIRVGESALEGVNNPIGLEFIIFEIS